MLAAQPKWAQKLLPHIYFEAIDNILEPIFNKVLSGIIVDEYLQCNKLVINDYETTVQRLLSGALKNIKQVSNIDCTSQLLTCS